MPTRISSGGRVELFVALSKAQAEIRDPVKDSQGHKHNFVSITATLESVRPVLSKYNLAIVQCVDEPVVDGNITWLPLTTLLVHGSGGYIENIARIPVDMSGDLMNPAQAVGSAITYLRRYALRSILGLGEKDDDAESTGMNPDSRRQPTGGTSSGGRQCSRVGQEAAAVTS